MVALRESVTAAYEEMYRTWYVRVWDFRGLPADALAS